MIGVQNGTAPRVTFRRQRVPDYFSNRPTISYQRQWQQGPGDEANLPASHYTVKYPDPYKYNFFFFLSFVACRSYTVHGRVDKCARDALSYSLLSVTRGTHFPLCREFIKKRATDTGPIRRICPFI